jgi:hypothetical protein
MILKHNAARFLLAAAPVLLATAAQADLTVKAHKTIHVTCTANVCVPHGPNAVLNVADLQTMLASANIRLDTNAASPNILIESALSVPGTSNLFLEALGSVRIDHTVSVAADAGLSIFVDQGGSGGNLVTGKLGAVHYAGTSGRLTIDGRPFTLVSSVASLASGIAAAPGGNFALAAPYNAGPDGDYPAAPIATAFTGRFEGLGNAISNLSVRKGNRPLGLFATIDTGGIAQNIVLTQEHVHATGNAKSVGGGIAAVNNGTIFNAHAAGKISTQGAGATGGALVGINNGTITASSADNTPQVGAACVGGLVGRNTGAISQSYADGRVAGVQPGGIACENSGTIVDSYDLAGVLGRGTSPYPGGLVSANDPGGTISTSYAAGQITAVSNFGGIAGTNNGSLSQAYWDIEDTGANGSLGCGAGACTGATGLADTALRASLPAGFDPAIWTRSGVVNGGLPYLVNNPPR